MDFKKIQKAEENIIRLPNVKSFGMIGDPGCEGLGTYNMKVFAGALKHSEKDDITLVAGDLVPWGTKFYYEEICRITEELAGNPVYVLRGNHDTGDYIDFFGKKNYALLCDGFTVIVLDNAMRTFEEEGLELARTVLAMEEVRQAILAFHIPLPNHFIKNSVSEEEFLRLKECCLPWKDKLRYLICGHVHSCFVDQIDGIPMICSGGGGAMIEDVSEQIRASDVNHHMVHFTMENGTLSYRFEDISEDCYVRERQNPILREQLEETVKGELMAHLRYLMFADRAKKRGLDDVANLFQALAESEYRHAKNFYAVLEQPAAFAGSVGTYIPGEKFEYQHMYRMMADYAAAHNAPLTLHAYEGALAAEKVHAKLLEEASGLDSFHREEIYVCPICGYVMTGDKLPDRCPVCGGPRRQYEEFRSGDTN